jgi:hypothetical protein
VDGISVPLAQIANHVAVQAEDFASINFNALNRTLGVALARLLHVEVSAEAVDEESKRFRCRHHLEADDDLHIWIQRNHLGADEFRILMKETAMCRRLHRWLIYSRWTERTTRLLLDYLRWENRYDDWAQKAAAQVSLLQISDQPLTGVDVWRVRTLDLLDEHQEWSYLRVDTELSQWAEEAGFHTKRDFKLELLRAKAARHALLRLLGDQLGPETEEETAPPVDEPA